MVRFIIQVYSHGFMVQVNFQQDKRIVTSFTRMLEVHERHFDKRTKRTVSSYKFTYAALIAPKMIFGIHRNLFDKFGEHLKQERVHPSEVEITIHEAPVGDLGKIELTDKPIPKDYQGPIIDFMQAPGSCKVVPLQTGRGKAQPLDTPIKIPGGWTTMGAVQVGQMVTAPDGQPTEVLGVYPQGETDVYRITFEDGRSTECCGDHLWKVYSYNHSDHAEIVDTHELIRRLARRAVLQNLWIDLIEPEDCQDIDLPIDPYVLGAKLHRDYLDSGIAERYLHASLAQRWALLQGLMDKEGHVDNDGSIVFKTRRHSLALAVQYLVRSLGGMATLGMCYNDGIWHQLVIETKDPQQVFRNHESRDKVGKFVYLSSNHIALRSIEYVGRKQTQCILVAHPEHLYVTNDFIVTHNTFCTLYAIAKMGIRAGGIMQSTFAETWFKDAKWMYENWDTEMALIRGKEQLVRAIKQGQAGRYNKSITIFTLDTIADYLKEYEETGKSTYGCEPHELYETLGIGIRFIDEAHTNLHFMFRQDILTNVRKSIILSATIKSNDPFKNRMYETIYPIPLRYEGLAWNKYIVAHAVGYRLAEPWKAKYMGPKGYSHILFEQYIMKNRCCLTNYLTMIVKIIEKRFMESYIPGQKLLVYMSSIDMCEIVAAHLSVALTEHNLRISAYHSLHEDEVLHNNDIVVSTPKKAGTGKDVKGLVMVLSTVAINSRETNVQMPGRLRDIQDLYPGKDPEFFYLTCMDLPKHMDYHRAKVEMFRPLMKEIHTHRSSFIV